MDTVGKRLKMLRASTGLSQKAFSEKINTTQATINRYENNDSEAPYRIITWYADYFDVSLDYIFCRTDNPKGKLYENEPDIIKEKIANKEEWKLFIEACFEPNSPMNAKLKDAIVNMIGSDKS